MLKLAFWNGKGIGEKEVELENMVGELEPDVLCVTETWIQGQDDEDEYQWPAGYRIICKSREKTKGGSSISVRTTGGTGGTVPQRARARGVVGEHIIGCLKYDEFKKNILNKIDKLVFTQFHQLLI